MASKKNGSGRGHIKPYKSYLFRTKDPVIDELRTIVTDTYGKINHKSLQKIEDGGGPTVGCTDAWFNGKTMRPTNAAVEAAGRQMGRKRVWVSHRSNR